jgi:hypothetical protein
MAVLWQVKKRTEKQQGDGDGQVHEIGALLKAKHARKQSIHKYF